MQARTRMALAFVLASRPALTKPYNMMMYMPLSILVLALAQDLFYALPALYKVYILTQCIN